MNTRDKQELAAWKSATAWIDAQSGILPATFVVDAQGNPTATPTPFGTAVTSLQGVITTLNTAAAGQSQQHSTAKGNTATTASLRAELWDDWMKPIAQTARFVIADIPSVAPALKLPLTKIDQQGLIAAATAMAAQAGNYEQLLIDNGLPPDFIAKLESATAAYDQAITTRRQAVAAQKGATSTIEPQLALGRKSIALIDTMIVRSLGKTSPELAAWRSAKLVASRSGTSAASVVTPATPETTPITAASATEPLEHVAPAVRVVELVAAPVAAEARAA